MICWLECSESHAEHPCRLPVDEAFQKGLRELGYVEGQNIIVEYRWAHGVVERLPDLAADLVGGNVGVIVASSNREITAAKEATTRIPIVMVVAIDPVGAGFIESMARPGGNPTGLAWAPAIEIVGKHIEFLKEVVPNLSRVAVLVEPGFPGIGSPESTRLVLPMVPQNRPVWTAPGTTAIVDNAWRTIAGQQRSERLSSGMCGTP